jgi:hypothetical protein
MRATPEAGSRLHIRNIGLQLQQSRMTHSLINIFRLNIRPGTSAPTSVTSKNVQWCHQNYPILQNLNRNKDEMKKRSLSGESGGRRDKG